MQAKHLQLTATSLLSLMAKNLSLILAFISFIFITTASGQNSTTSSTKKFTLVNKCKETIWPAILTKGNDSHGDSFTLKQGETAFYNVPTGWSGRIWARTQCNFDKNGTGSCQTGGCGSLNCSDPSSPPNTIAEFTLSEPDYFDVSLVDGFNVPIAVSPLNTKGNCSNAGCDGDLKQSCPSQLAVVSVGKVIACRSACDTFNTDEYCCRGRYNDPVACLPFNYSKTFKQACPASSSYAFDREATSIITCSASDYIVAFCATRYCTFLNSLVSAENTNNFVDWNFRNETLCSFSNNQVKCNTPPTTNGSNVSLPRGWWTLLLALPLTFILQIMI